MSTLGSINSINAIQDTFQPLLVASIVFRDSQTAPTVLLLSSHNLNTGDGGNSPTGITGFPYNGGTFQTRIKNQEIAATQALSSDGIDITPTVTLQLVDADKAMWNTYEKAIGFKGAQLTLYYIFWEVGTNNFSSDYRTIFTGICDPGNVTETGLSVKATNRMNMNQIFLPITKIARRCVRIFPDTTGLGSTDAAARHQTAADDPSSDFWLCGYSYLATGSNARGNKPTGDIAFRSCNYTLSNCIDRLGNTTNPGGHSPYSPYNPVEYDKTNRRTARYAGVQWDQPATFTSRGYGQNTAQKGFNALNEGKYNDYVPMGWGTFWIDPVVLNIVGDANYTNMEVLIGAGQYSNIRHVICNDIDVDKLATDSGTQKAQIALQLFWNDLTTGDRSGACNQGAIYNSHGDPYGGFRVINVHVPSQLTPSSNIPRIRVLVDGPMIRKYADLTSISVTGGVATATLVGANTDIASNGVFPFTIENNTKADVNGNYTSLTNWTSGPPGTFQFPTSAANGTGTGGRVYYKVFTTNPAWIIMDVLINCGWTYSQIDISTFETAGAFYDGSISYNGISGFVNVANDGVSVTQVSGNDFSTLSPGGTIYINGVPKVINTITDSAHLSITISFGGFLNNVTFLSSGPNSHARFKLGFGISQRASGSDILRQLRTACRSILRPNLTTGLMQLIPEQTLGAQQPSAMAGSNYNTAIASIDATGASLPGYVAWKFDYSSILPAPDGSSSLTLDQLDIKNCPNRVSFEFTDEDNEYQSDSLSLVDSVDVGRVTRPVDGQIAALGILNYDQAERASATFLAKLDRGNLRRDTGGTYSLTFKSSFKCVNLQVGNIVLIDYPQLGINDNLSTAAGAGINGFLARVISVKPDHNFRTATIVANFHVDGWYVDTFGQSGLNPAQQTQFRNSLNRPPFPWSPYYTQPLTGDALFDHTDWQMGILQKYDTSASAQPLAQVSISGNLPINVFAQNGLTPPSIGAQGTTAPTGGTVKAGRTYYGQLCGYDSTGAITTPSNPNSPCQIDVPAGADTATLTFPVDLWPPNTVSYELFVGTLRSRMSSQASGVVTPPATPASITITSYKEDTWGIPDVEFNSLGIDGKLVIHAGIIGDAIYAVTSTTIQLAIPSDNGFATNQFAPDGSGNPYYIMLLGLTGSSTYLPIANWKIASNTFDTFTLAGGGIDPTTIARGDGTTGLKQGDVIVITMRPTVGSDGSGNYIQDVNFVNAACPYYEAHEVTGATNATPIVITIAEDAGVVTGNKVYITSVTGNTAANGPFYITRLSSTTMSLYSDAALTSPVAGSGAWTGGGILRQQDLGLVSNFEAGNELYCLFGTGAGTSYKITSNTKDKLYIDGNWIITPDATSVFAVLAQNWDLNAENDTINNSVNNKPVTFDMNVPNYSGEVIFFQSYTLDGGNHTCFRSQSPWRMIYIFGQVGNLLAAVHIVVSGTLAIGADLGPRTRPNSPITVAGVSIEVKQTPAVNPVIVQIYTDAVLWMTLTIAPGAYLTSATPVQISSAPTINSGQNIRVDVTSVGTTSPGSDLAVTLYVN